MSKQPWTTLKVAAVVSGGLSATYAMASPADIPEFERTKLTELREEFEHLTVEYRTLPGLQKGDHCHCLGEGLEALQVEGQRNLKPYVWSFALSHGCWEEAYKCFEKVRGVSMADDKLDAARYRELRSCHWDDSELAVVLHPKKNVMLGTVCPSEESLDELLDARLAKKHGEYENE